MDTEKTNCPGRQAGYLETSELVPKDELNFTRRIRSEILALQSEYASLIYVSTSQAWRLSYLGPP